MDISSFAAERGRKKGRKGEQAKGRRGKERVEGRGNSQGFWEGGPITDSVMIFIHSQFLYLFWYWEFFLIKLHFG